MTTSGSRSIHADTRPESSSTPLDGKHIVVGVSGGIAAYKTPELVRRLRDAGADVRVVMTEGAKAFVTPLTFQAVSGSPVSTDLLDEQAEAGMGHIELARWADFIVIAPVTANLIARLAGGMADDLLTTIVLASPAPTILAPAMNQQMWAHPRVDANVQRLRDDGVAMIGPDAGDQACGDVGPGRMREPQAILEAVISAAKRDDTLVIPTASLRDKRVLITAGPTVEAIDPVRALTNFSSGKMGYSIAEAAARAGAAVTLVSGPTHLACPQGVERVDVRAALDMYEAVHSRIRDCDIFIAVAAVADYRPAQPANAKIKKSGESLHLELIPNPDILASVGALPDRPFTVGFAAETENLVDNARHKLQAKNIDMIAANIVGESGTGFGADDNALTLIDAHSCVDLGPDNKQQLAGVLIAKIADRYHASNRNKNPRRALTN